MGKIDRVLVAGAGPVGLSAAVALAQRGIAVTVLEKRAGLSPASKASTFHPSTLAVLDDLGVMDGLQSKGYVVRTIQYRTIADGIFAEFDMGLLKQTTRFPYRLHVEQAELTPLLLQKLLSYENCEVHFNAEVVEIENGDDGVRARCGEGAAARWFAGDYLVAADGAHSKVRGLLGIGFDVSVYPTRGLRVMTQFDLNEYLPGLAPLTYLFNGTKSCSFLRMPDCWRIIQRIPAEISDEQALDDAWILAELQSVMPMVKELVPVMMKDVYPTSRAIADSYAQGRVFLAGDSAHLTNTRGGMNMNCGIHDAYVLAEALDAANQGDASLLAGYGKLRRGIATDAVIPRSHTSVAGGSEWLGEVRERAADRDKALNFLRSAAMLDIAPRPARDLVGV